MSLADWTLEIIPTYGVSPVIEMREFQELVLAQRPASKPWTPVTDYSFDARKEAEGDQPRLILETFHPTRILDVGAGPGHLVRLLNDLAGHTLAYGADIDEQADVILDIATRKRLTMRPSYLVICREVLEHLTLLQIRQAVSNLCTLSSKYVYLTTRFSSEHDILRVETSDDLDPTHITIPSKDLIRLLFVLEGFKRRADLEAAMDWKQLGRVLVYERAV